MSKSKGISNEKMVNIRRSTSDDKAIWDQYLLEHQQGNFYQSFDWKQVNENNFKHECIFLVAEQENKFVGVFPIVFIKSKIFGKIMTSMPFVNFGGPCSDSPEVEAAFVNELKKITKENNADYLEIRTLHSVSDQLPSSLHKVSMTLDLNADPDVIWNAFKSKHRTNIRRTYKNNIHVKQGRHELLDDYYTLLSKSWKNLGTPIYKKLYFENILNTFPDSTKIFVAYIDEKPIATAFNGYYKGVVEGMWAGTLPEFRSLQPNYVLYWEMIKDSCETGYQYFHLGRSTSDTGAEVFKKKWNAYPKQLYWQYILNNQNDIPQLNTNNSKFKLAIKVWRKLPLSITTVIGPLIAKSIP